MSIYKKKNCNIHIHDLCTTYTNGTHMSNMFKMFSVHVKKNVEMNRYAQNRNILKPNNLFLRVWANFGIMRK